MRKNQFLVAGATLALAVAAAGPVAADSHEAMELGEAEGKTLVVAMKGPGAGNPFWAAVEKGAMETGEALGIDVQVVAPPRESDTEGQIALIEDQITKGAAGIALAPTDPAALAATVDDALAEGVSVVFIDTIGENEGITFIGTDNVNGAALAGSVLCDNLAEGDEVAILQGIITQSTGMARAEGGKAGVEACGLNLVAEIPANWNRGEGQTAMDDILTRNPDVKGVFGSNDEMALGAVQAIADQGLEGELVIVGYDANPDAAQAVLDGKMTATIAQAPYNMGKFGVESLIKLINGETLDPVIDTGTQIVEASNAADFVGG